MRHAYRSLMCLCSTTIIMSMFYGLYNNLYAEPIEPYRDSLILGDSSTTCRSDQSVSNKRSKGEEQQNDFDNSLIDDALNTMYSDIDLAEVAKKYPEVRKGGWYVPPSDTTRHKVAIIVPYRARPKHLAIFLNYIHPFLMKSQIEYGIFVVEQKGTDLFNRGKLLNVGFLESQMMRDWKCFIFHDVDLLPLDRRILYQCAKQPLHISAAVDALNFKLPYKTLFGGVSALTLDQFKSVNGYSNKYWGWGGEDDDLFRRLYIMGYRITRYNESIAQYTMLGHKKEPPNQKSYLYQWIHIHKGAGWGEYSAAGAPLINILETTLDNLSKTRHTFKTEGLSSIKYEVDNIKWHHLYTHIVANIDESNRDPYVANMLL